jgi:hypothetical protein
VAATFDLDQRDRRTSALDHALGEIGTVALQALQADIISLIRDTLGLASRQAQLKGESHDRLQ